MHSSLAQYRQTNGHGHTRLGTEYLGGTVPLVWHIAAALRPKEQHVRLIGIVDARLDPV